MEASTLDFAEDVRSTSRLSCQIRMDNCKGGFFLTQALHADLRDHGRVINVSSAGSRLTDPNIIVYTWPRPRRTPSPG